MTDTSNARSPGFTLNKLANAMKGLPRDAPILIKTSDGAMRPIDHITGVKISEGTDGVAVVPEGAYAIVLVVAT
jgi:hypothetical protein